MIGLTTWGLLVASVLANPLQLSKRAVNKPNLGENDFTDKQKRQLEDGFADAVALAGAGIAETGPENPIFLKYFTAGEHENVKYVLEQIYGEKGEDGKGTGGKKLRDITIRTDYPNEQGELSCEGGPFLGSTRDNEPEQDEATTILCPTAFSHGGIDKGYKNNPDDKNEKENPEAVTCQSIGDTMSWKMNTLGATLLHEYTHFGYLVYPNLQDPTKDGFTDDPEEDFYGPFAARQVVKEYGRDAPEQIADVYAWFCTEAYWHRNCDNRPFKDPTEDDNDPNCGNKPCTEKDPKTPPKDGNQSSGTAPKDKPIPEPACASASPAPNQLSFSLSDGNLAAEEFCRTEKYYDTMIVPPISLGDRKTKQGDPKVLGVNNRPDLDKNPKNDIWLRVRFADNTCIGSFKFGIGVNNDEKYKYCKARFDQILGKCDNATAATPRFGGVLIDQCAEYTITKSTAEPESFKIKPNGDLKCEDIDTSAIGGEKSPLFGKCSCKYSNYHAHDVFEKKKPKCEDLKVEDLVLVIN